LRGLALRVPDADRRLRVLPFFFTLSAERGPPERKTVVHAYASTTVLRKVVRFAGAPMTQSLRTKLVIVGAGPFGLALSAYARHLGVPHVVLGEPMGFWKRHMPAGMILRSGLAWHLDVRGSHTMHAFLGARASEPIALETYLAYTSWFQERAGVESVGDFVTRIEHDGVFRVVTANGPTFEADAVVVATGFANFARLPPEVVRVLPEGRFAHTADVVDFAPFVGRRVLIVGGRQSAFEWAALLAEAGAASVAVVHRHATPRFAAVDWSWVEALCDGIGEDPASYRALPVIQKEALARRMWEAGRLTLEPWLAPRIARPEVRLHAHAEVVASAMDASGARIVRLQDESVLAVDHVILATGYAFDVERVAFLRPLLPRIETRCGFPVLDDHLQTSIPGLYTTSFAATQEFGPFFGFTVAARASASLIGNHLRG
jgi:cation diffusion facilitator CzcD-associated flavoprotein CzcO